MRWHIDWLQQQTVFLTLKGAEQLNVAINVNIYTLIGSQNDTVWGEKFEQ